MPALDGWDLERYRAYLKVRARMLELDPRLRLRFDESDLVQETLARAHASGAPIRGQSHRERMAYLDTVFNSVFTDHLREHHAGMRDIDKEQAQEVLTESTAAYRLDPADSGVSPSEQAARREEFLKAMAALEQLPANERDVLILVHIQQLSHTEAAQRLGLTKGQVSGSYARGITRLRDALGPEGKKLGS